MKPNLVLNWKQMKIIGFKWKIFINLKLWTDLRKTENIIELAKFDENNSIIYEIFLLRAPEKQIEVKSKLNIFDFWLKI